MRARTFFLFTSLSAAALLASACNLIFSIEPGEPLATGGGNTGGGGSSTSTSTSTSSTSTGSGGCAPNSVTCEGAVLHACDDKGMPKPDVTCDAVAACDAAAGACIDAATLPRLGVGNGRACAIEEDGSVRCWGINSGQALIPGDLHAMIPTAKVVNDITSARLVALGTSHACTLRGDGSVICWGTNDSGETGVPVGSSITPAQVTLPGSKAAVEISAAHRCTCARLADGAVACWGQEETGCLGNAAQAPKITYTPTLVPGVSAAVQLRVGVYGTPTCVRHASGKVTCWGTNTTPKEITGVDDAIDLAVARNTVFIRSASKGVLWSVPMGGGFTAPTSYGIVGAVKAISGGDGMCAIRMDGTVACALMESPPPPLPAQVPMLPAGEIVEIAAGYSYSYGQGLQCLRLKGSPIATRVYCWGDDLGGALGAGAPANFTTPQPVPTVTTAAKISASHTSTTVVLQSGAVVAWGQTSALPGSASASPHAISIFSNDNAIVHTNDIARRAYVVKKNGALQLFDTGAPLSNQRLLKVPAGDWREARSFGNVDIGVRTGGLIHVYGDDAHANDSGIFGDGTNTVVADTAASVPSIGDATAFAAHGNDYGVMPIQACATLGAGGAVACWGNNDFGEVGSGAVSPSVNMPAPVTIPNNEVIVSIAAGARFSCAASSVGNVYCWGRNDEGQLGTGDPGIAEYPSPLPVSGITTAKGVTANESHACAWLADGAAVCWGSNSDGQLGDGTFDNRFAPVPVSNLTNVASMSAGPNHVCATHTDGKVSCWGSSYNGQIGTGVVGIFPAPKMVLGL